MKLASYEGTSSSGTIKELIGWNEDIKNKDIIVIEDIVDTGNTLERIVDELVIRKVSGIKIAALLLKPDAYTKNIPLDYIVKSIMSPNISHRFPQDCIQNYLMGIAES